MFECLFFSCIMFSSQMQVVLQSEYDLVGSGKEFVGFIDLNSLELSGVQDTNSQILWLNKNYSHGFVANIHSHPFVSTGFWGDELHFFCVPSDKDLIAKQILGVPQYLYCGGNTLIVY